MPDALATTPASANFQKLKDKLRELFELDKADLDFGIYRVLRQRHREIVEFLDNHLETTVREALRSHQSIQTDQVADDLAKAEAAAKTAEINPDQSPRVIALREKLKSAGDVEAVADEVYSHLLTFFSRYYQEGDFIGLHRSTVHGREKYMIPYNGEEVKLVWANMDQYYIKSSELLRDYTFLIKKSDWLAAQAELPLGDLPEQVCVHFKLVEGDTEKDNRKASGKTTRAFALAEPACTEKDGALYINFAYREHAAERNLQDKLNADTIKTLAGALPGVWRTLLLGADPTHQPKDKKDTRTVLQKHLRAYTARHQFDYFIHKDLGGFLRRELDFYLKNEVMHLDDIENVGSSKAEEYLSKLRAIRRCAMPVIRMLAQLEDFQKKLWLKKKFVVETRYCLTLDRVPEELYPEICKNDAQWQEWEELYKISELKPKRTVEFLKVNRSLSIDTKHYDQRFTLLVLRTGIDLDESSLCGYCICSENYQALELASDKFTTSTKLLYIDPPYNTGSDANFAYKDAFQESSWLSMMADRLESGRKLLCDTGFIISHIDENESEALKELINIRFGPEQNLGTVTWDKRNPKGDSKRIATQNESIHFAIKSSDAIGSESAKLVKRKKNAAAILQKASAILKKHKGSTQAARQEFKNWMSEQDFSGGEKAYALLDDNGDVYQSVSMAWPNKTRAPDEYFIPLTHPKTKQPCPLPERGWRNPPSTMKSLLESNLVVFGEDHTTQPRRKYLLKENLTENLPSMYYYGGSADEELAALGLAFPDYPKPLEVACDLIYSVTSEAKGIVVDFFAGSGTAGHAVIALNKEDQGTRRYVLAEIGQYFDTVLVPRLKKVVYSTDWKDGKPQCCPT